MELLNFLKKIYKSNKNKCTRNYQCLQNWSHMFLICVRIGIVLVICAVYSQMLMPMFIFIQNGQKTLIIEVYIPGVSTEGIGFIVTTLYHIFISVFAACGLIATDATFVSFVIHLFPMTDIFGNAIAKLQNMYCKKRTHWY